MPRGDPPPPAATRDVAGITVYMQPVQPDHRCARQPHALCAGRPKPGLNELSVWVKKLVARLQTLPQLADVASDLQELRGCQVYVEIDRGCRRAPRCDSGGDRQRATVWDVQRAALLAFTNIPSMSFASPSAQMASDWPAFVRHHREDTRYQQSRCSFKLKKKESLRWLA